MSEDDLAELKRAVKVMLDAGYRMGDVRNGWRFSFRIDNETYDKWMKLATTPP